MFAPIRSTITKDDVANIDDGELVYHYLGIDRIPITICSPLREDKNPSFRLYTMDGGKIFYKDFSTGESGDIYKLLMRLFNIDFQAVLDKIYLEMGGNTIKGEKVARMGLKQLARASDTELDIEPRWWNREDLAYWMSYGINYKALRFADVHPITHIYIIKEGRKTAWKTHRLAYAYFEHKDMKTTIKVYQPMNKKFKWISKHDGSVISLWTKIPDKGEKLVICASLKDALCLWCNTGIPAVALQGEGYLMSQTAISQLKKRFDKIYILFDNDEAGLKYGEILANYTGFENIVLPRVNETKDVSDLYKSLENKQEFKTIISSIIP